MKKLDRSLTQAPECLGNYCHKTHTWDNDFTGEDKKSVWIQLDLMQKGKCAYCESFLGRTRHIEHFRRKSQHQSLTFAWSNLLGCCGANTSCGHHKDLPGRGWPYQANDLIDPSTEDPDHFFHFQTDGSIKLREGLNPLEEHRAKETLRVLNLDEDRGPLRRRRAKVVQLYFQLEPGIVQALMDFEPADAKAYAQEELARIEDDELSAPLRHLFIDFVAAN
ncbi:retron Ec78 anti-phage system effector HNH endonuclease PtuB [Rhodopirellula sp. MGV]|uniref:retron Ec78 anti-phage system effector HNH endonuclease PtuB n=1 Tax=Rhodopirellula sp. MGV TaxID=2023130 RepID=UPI0013042F33|nr:retron Ec78 anti-phage system effector HNH endonuclease PtuB [Rhodopirellula sp. MGV]